MAVNKGLTFKIDWKESKYITYRIDNLRLIQVISNILSNALKFTEMGFINISIRLEKDLLKFTITDTGIGMTEGELKVLFNPFVQAQDNIARKYGGTGLGMAIVNRYVKSNEWIHRCNQFIWRSGLKLKFLF
ncbi:ATP-binding protein [Photobacterium leiognathi]|uniref:ATP-binding protein n=1 Tax=Photobacterium leiognathi TaxID=553611 RepID=UPI003DA0512E